MKTIAIIVLNDPEMINQNDFDQYQTEKCYFKVYHIDKTRKEYNSAAEGAEALSMAVNKVCQVEKEGVSSAIIYAFGDVGVSEARKLVSIPVMGLGKSSIHIASTICRNGFTIIPPLLNYNSEIFQPMLDEENLDHKFIRTDQELGLSAAQLKNNPEVLKRAIQVAGSQIEKNNVDTFVLGCGCFFNTAKPLEQELRRRYGSFINVIDTVELTLKVASTF